MKKMLTSHLPAIQGLLADLSPKQAEILTLNVPVLQIIAAAGAGKTRTIIALLQYLLLSRQESPRRILMLSFSRKAVAELRERLPRPFRAQVHISTFHGFCYRALVKTEKNDPKNPIRILTEKEKMYFLRNFFQIRKDRIGGIPFPLLLEDLQSPQPSFPDIYKELKESLAKYKQNRNLWEYEDLIQFLLDGLRTGASKFVDIRNAVDCIIVDEFQDTDPTQLAFLKLMRPKRLVIVGDDYQAIYAFRGATIEPFLNFSRFFSETHTAFLETNFRSCADIVCLANHVIRHSSRQLRKRVQAHRQASGKALFSITIERGQEATLAKNLNRIKSDWKLLVRSNFRREVWKEAGLSEDRILTVHKSKGLEFSFVFLDLIGGWTASLPEKKKAFKGLIDEEVRIHYVAVTRAKEKFFAIHLPDYKKKAVEGVYFNKFYKKKCKKILPEEILYFNKMPSGTPF